MIKPCWEPSTGDDQEGREIYGKTVYNEIGISSNRWILPYNFNISALIPKCKQIVISMTSVE